MSVTFTTTLFQADGKNATGISIPPDSIAALNAGKKPKVVVHLNDYTYRTTVAAYGDVFLIPVSQEHRAAAGLTAGDEVVVTLELDTEPRTLDVPEALTAALAQKEGAQAAFDALAYSKRKELARQVSEAKTPETRDRRIAKIVAELP